MKRVLVVLAAIAATMACAASIQAQTVLFSDNFDIDGYSYDVNTDNLGIRQGGTLAPITWNVREENKPGQPYAGHVILNHPWIEGSGGSSSLEFFVYDKSWPDYYGGPYENYAWASPNHSFTNAGALSIEVDIDPLGPNSSDAVDGHFAALIFGTDVQGTYAIPMDGSYVTPTSPGMSFWIKDDGRWSVQNDNGAIATGTVATPKPGPNSYYNVRAVLSTAGYGIGADAFVSIIVDGESVYSGVRTSGFANNYITLAAQGLSPNEYNVSQFDNFAVTMIPEPSSILALLSGLCGAGMVIRRRK